MNLVFASGFLFPQHFHLLPQVFGLLQQQFGQIDYFNGIENHIGAAHQMRFPDVPPLGSARERAQALASAIDARFPQGEIHIIAHSMGGIDSRFVIGENLHGLAEPGRIVSLTTLATPHGGSPVADLVAGPAPTGIHRELYDTLRSLFSAADIKTGAVADLTTAAALHYPKVAQTHPHIRYRSYAAAGRPGSHPTSHLLALTHEYVLAKTGQQNDGVVTVESARYGEFQGPLLCDHADVVGHNLDNLFGTNVSHFATFDHIISLLQI